MKIGSSIKKTSKEYLGEKHTLAKLIVVAALIAVAVLVFYKPMYRVSAPFTITAEDRRAIASPTEGICRRDWNGGRCVQRFGRACG